MTCDCFLVFSYVINCSKLPASISVFINPSHQCSSVVLCGAKYILHYAIYTLHYAIYILQYQYRKKAGGGGLLVTL